MVSLQDIKSDFPNWPDDVIDRWLLKLANQPGMCWPPPDPMSGHRWELLLTNQISWWKDVTWTLETRDCAFALSARLLLLECLRGLAIRRIVGGLLRMLLRACGSEPCARLSSFRCRRRDRGAVRRVP
jgi:hypothetical protein